MEERKFRQLFVKRETAKLPALSPSPKTFSTNFLVQVILNNAVHSCGTVRLFLLTNNAMSLKKEDFENMR